jgi:hypothetical protein
MATGGDWSPRPSLRRHVWPTALGVRTELTAALEAPARHSVFNWLRNGAGAGILAHLAAGRLAATRVLPPRDEELARIERWLADLLASS